MNPTMKSSTKTPDTPFADAHPVEAPTTEAPAEAQAVSASLDHDGDGRMGGLAPAPTRQPMVVLKDVASQGLFHGEVIQVTPADAKGLLANDQARNATEAEVELAQPRVRDWPV